MSVVRYGLIGSGYFGMALGRGLVQLDGARVTRVYDPANAASAVAEFGSVESASAEALALDPEVDAVIVASPNWAHPEAVLAAANARKHVFCEKPIALNVADCVAMVDAAQREGVRFMAGHVMNFMAGVRRAKQLIREGAIGDVVFCRAVRNGWEEPQPQISWKKRRELSGGHLYHHIHELDVVQFIMGRASTATMIGGNVAHQGPEFGDEDDMLLLSLEFGGGSFATLEYGSAFRWPEHYVLIEGTLGAIKIDLQEAGCILRTPERTERFLLHRSKEEDHDRSRIYASNTTDGAVMYGAPNVAPPLWLAGIVEEEMAYFHGLMSGAPIDPEFAALTDGSAARDAIATADALTRSLKEGRKVNVSDVFNTPERVSA